MCNVLCSAAMLVYSAVGAILCSSSVALQSGTYPFLLPSYSIATFVSMDCGCCMMRVLRRNSHVCGGGLYVCIEKVQWRALFFSSPHSSMHPFLCPSVCTLNRYSASKMQAISTPDRTSMDHSVKET